MTSSDQQKYSPSISSATCFARDTVSTRCGWVQQTVFLCMWGRSEYTTNCGILPTKESKHTSLVHISTYCVVFPDPDSPTTMTIWLLLNYDHVVSNLSTYTHWLRTRNNYCDGDDSDKRLTYHLIEPIHMSINWKFLPRMQHFRVLRSVRNLCEWVYIVVLKCTQDQTRPEPRDGRSHPGPADFISRHTSGQEIEQIGKIWGIHSSKCG